MPANGLIVTDVQGNPYSYIWDPSTLQFTLTPVPGISPSSANLSITNTAMALITSALRLINVVASGETVELSEANDSLMVLNQMIDGWNADRLSVFTTRSDDYALNIGQQAYTLGPGGDWNTNRPAAITSMSAILITNPANPIELPIEMYTIEQWQTQIPVKVVSSTFPLVCLDDGGHPLRTLNFWPIPQQVNNIRIYSWQGLGWPATLNSAVAFPPGYAEAFRYNLAVRLSAEFAAPLTPTVQAIAIETLARLKTMNAPALNLRSDLVPSGRGNSRAELFGIAF